MQEIFGSPELNKFLVEGVITNRVFFQSRNIAEFQKLGKWNDMQKWCLPYVKEIIEMVDSEIIFAQSITTFEQLIYKLGGRFDKVLIPDKGRGLMRLGWIGEKMIFGIKHPTGSHPGLSDEECSMISKVLSDILEF